jgi:hypothetical protein
MAVKYNVFLDLAQAMKCATENIPRVFVESITVKLLRFNSQ